MAEVPPSVRPSFRECREAARAVRRAEFGRQAIDVIRPRGVLALYRARAPLPLLLYVTGLTGRLLWHGVNNFAVLEPPIAVREPPVGQRTDPGRSRAAVVWLGRLDRWWDQLLFGVPPFLALLVTLPVAPLPGVGPAAILLPLAALTYIAVLMLAGVLAAMFAAYRQVEGRVRRLDKLAGGTLRGHHWSMPLCHLAEPARGEALLTESLALVRLRTEGAELFVCFEGGITTPGAREAILRAPNVIRLAGQGPGIFVVRGRSRFTAPDLQAAAPASGITLMVIGTALAVAVEALIVAGQERSACGPQPCPGRPTEYGDALYWLWNQLTTFGDPDGLTPATAEARVIGVLTSLLGLVLLACVITAVLRYLRFQRRIVRDVYAELENPFSRVLLLVVNNTERDATIASVRAATGEEQLRREYFHHHTIFHLGTIGRAEILLAQSGQGMLSPISMAPTAAALIRRLRPDFVILTGVCYGLREDNQNLADVVVSTQLMAVDHRKVVDVEPGRPTEITLGDRVTPPATLVDRCRSASADWTDPTVHFGLVLSSNTLLNSATLRDSFRSLAPNAIAGEMEGAALYAAATRESVEWILVKGISDWGTAKTDDAQWRAARAAADYVTHVIRTGGLDRPATHDAGTVGRP